MRAGTASDAASAGLPRRRPSVDAHRVARVWSQWRRCSRQMRQLLGFRNNGHIRWRNGSPRCAVRLVPTDRIQMQIDEGAQSPVGTPSLSARFWSSDAASDTVPSTHRVPWRTPSLDDGLTEYERQRLAHVARNREYMARLGIQALAGEIAGPSDPKPTKRAPARR